jgi:hypothetical protein
MPAATIHWLTRESTSVYGASAIRNARCGVIASIPVTKLRIIAIPFQSSLPSMRRTLARHLPNSRSNVWTVYFLYFIGESRLRVTSPIQRDLKLRLAVRDSR